MRECSELQRNNVEIISIQNKFQISHYVDSFPSLNHYIINMFVPRAISSKKQTQMFLYINLFYRMVTHIYLIVGIYVQFAQEEKSFRFRGIKINCKDAVCEKCCNNNHFRTYRLEVLDPTRAIQLDRRALSRLQILSCVVYDTPTQCSSSQKTCSSSSLQPGSPEFGNVRIYNKFVNKYSIAVGL